MIVLILIFDHCGLPPGIALEIKVQSGSGVIDHTEPLGLVHSVSWGSVFQLFGGIVIKDLGVTVSGTVSCLSGVFPLMEAPG